MGTILDDIASATRKRVALLKERVPQAQVEAEAHALYEAELKEGRATGYDRFERALSAPGVSFICEVKKASPSKGLIAADFPYIEIAREYEAAGAAAISVLTEPDFFMGSADYLRRIADTASVPLLRKDFTVDSYQIYEAKLLGASAVLLICTLLDRRTLARYIETARSVGLAALVEAHDEAEAEAALEAGARIVGVNNRDLRTFAVDIGTSLRLRNLVPRGILFVAESGIKTADDVKALADGGVDAALIGEALMRSPDKAAYLNMLRGGA
jgi:indole-3-glycerol phosphate synthase